MAIRMARRSLLATALFAMAGSARWGATQDHQTAWPNRAIFLPSRDKNERAAVVTTVAVHPAGDRIAAAGDDHLIRIYDVEDGELLHELEGHTDWVRGLDFSPDGAKLVSVGQDGRVQFWDVAEGREIRQLHRVGASLQAVRFSRDGSRIYVASFDSFLRVFSADEATLTNSWKCSSTDVRTVAVSHDDSLVAAAGRDGVIRIWKQEGELLFDLPSHERRIRHLEFSLSGSQLFSVGDDRILRVDDVVEPENGYDLPPVQGKLLSLAVLNEELVAAGASNNQIYIWNTDTKEMVGQLRAHTGSVAALAASSGSLISAGYDASIRVWSIGQNVAQRPGAAPDNR